MKREQKYDVTFIFQYTHKVRVGAKSKIEAERFAGSLIDPSEFGGATVADIRVRKVNG